MSVVRFVIWTVIGTVFALGLIAAASWFLDDPYLGALQYNDERRF